MPDHHLHLTFLGIRGEIEIRSARHRRHSALLVQYQDYRIMLDCGADWLDRVAALHPSAILLTHAHPDHAWGLVRGAPCPVYATAETWTRLERYPIVERQVVAVGHRFRVGLVMWEPFAVEHSTRAPAVGYRLAFEDTVLFYVPDVAVIRNQHAALHGVTLYIGDGASIVRPFAAGVGGIEQIFRPCGVKGRQFAPPERRDTVRISAPCDGGQYREPISESVASSRKCAG
jgi:Beta-lactamase superfamily domain